MACQTYDQSCLLTCACLSDMRCATIQGSDSAGGNEVGCSEVQGLMAGADSDHEQGQPLLQF